MHDILIALSVCAGILALVWALCRLMLMPVTTGKNTRIQLLVTVTGQEAGLEQTVRGLIWLRDNGTLLGKIIINCDSCDDDTRKIADTLAKKYDNVIIYDGGETDGRKRT